MTKEFRVVKGEHCLGTWTDLKSAKRLFDELKKGFDNLFLQPCYDESKDAGINGKTFHSTFDMVMQNPGWNLSLQTHKWMGVE